MWFCQNSAISDNKRIFTLPIGLEDISLGRAGRPKFFGESQRRKHKTNRVFVPPMSPTNSIRRPTVLKCRNSAVFDVYPKFMGEKEYFSISSQYAFVLCLEGNGFENHRIWESLYQGSFPVVLSTPWSKSLQYLGLPILYVDSIEELDYAKLESFRSKHSTWNPLNAQTLWAPFWKKLANGDLSEIKYK
jgi:hypothetical protein